MSTIKISGISSSNLLKRAKNALEVFQGSPLKTDTKARQFLKNLLGLNNEHTLDSVTSSTGQMDNWIDEKRFEEMKSRMVAEMIKRGFPIKNHQAQQVLAVALYDKSYKEVSEIHLKSAVIELKNVSILKYGNESILTLNGAYINATFPGTDLEISYDSLMSVAYSLASQFGTEVKEITLPDILASDYQTEDVIELAKKMGYCTLVPSIFECIEKAGNGASKVFIDGMYCKYGLNDDFVGDLQSAADDGEDPFDVPVWTVDLSSGSKEYEYFILFDDLCNAITKDGGKTWMLPQKEEKDIKIEFF